MIEYKELLTDVYINGEERQTRNGLTRSLFGKQLTVDCTKGFPILTTKKIYFKGIVGELLWFMSGDTNIKYLIDNGINIWTKNAYDYYLQNWSKFYPDVLTYDQFQTIIKNTPENSLRILWSFGSHYTLGNCGEIYGYWWRNELPKVIQGIKDNPFDRRHMVITYMNDNQALPPCHVIYQFYVSSDGFIDVHIYQRSADIFLGVPFNISSYALLLHMVAKEFDYTPRKVIFSYGDIHLYNDHIAQAKQLLDNEPKPLPELWLNPDKRIFEYGLEDIKLVGYEHGGTIKGEMVV